MKHLPNFHQRVIKHLGDIEKHLGKNEKWLKSPEKTISKFEKEIVNWDKGMNRDIKALEGVMEEFERSINGIKKA